MLESMDLVFSTYVFMIPSLLLYYPFFVKKTKNNKNKVKKKYKKYKKNNKTMHREHGCCIGPAAHCKDARVAS